MKKIIILIGIFLIAIIFSSCEKDEQPRYDKITILDRTGGKIKAMENHIDKKRSTLNPLAYDSLATYCTNEVMVVLMDELQPDSVGSKQGAIATVVAEYIKFYRDHHPKKKSKVWARLDVGVNDDTYRCCEAYSEKLLKRLKDYCGMVTCSPEWGNGERVLWIEAEIENLFVYDPDPTVEWQYRDRLYDYFKNFAVDPNNKAKYSRKGFLNFGWFD